MILNFKNNKFFPTLVLFLSVLILSEVFLLTRSHPENLQEQQNKTLNAYAEQVMKTCEQDRYHPACYDEEIPKLMDNISMEDAFKVTSIIQAKDESYAYCHILGHKIGARELDKNPTAWKDVIARIPSGICSNGGAHGVLQQKFRTEEFTPDLLQKVKPELSVICEERDTWHPTGIEQGSCYHGIGHLTMYLTNADIDQSISLCDDLGHKTDGRDMTQLCHDGAYMQLFQPLEAEDFSLIKGKEISKEQVVSFCKKFTGAQRSPCWSESWPLFYDQIMEPAGLYEHCNSNMLSTKEDNDRCFLALFYVVAAQKKLNSGELNDYCTNMPQSRSGQCFANSASRMIEVDYGNTKKAVDFCSNAPGSENKTACFDELVRYSTYNFHKGSEPYYNLCNSLPEEWKTKCLASS